MDAKELQAEMVQRLTNDPSITRAYVEAYAAMAAFTYLLAKESGISPYDAAEAWWGPGMADLTTAQVRQTLEKAGLAR